MKLKAVLHDINGRVCEVEIIHQPGGARDKEYWMMVKPLKKTTGHFHVKDGEVKEMALLRACLWVYQENKSIWWSKLEKIDVHEETFELEDKKEEQETKTLEELKVEARQKAFRSLNA